MEVDNDLGLLGREGPACPMALAKIPVALNGGAMLFSVVIALSNAGARLLVRIDSGTIIKISYTVASNADEYAYILEDKP